MYRIRFTLISLFALMFLLQGTACTAPRNIGYQGKVLEYETKEPIEGAVVVAYWYERRATVAGGSTRLFEVKETLTDKNGEWNIVGPEEERGDSYYSFLTGTYFMQLPSFLVFKPGYCPWPKGFYIDACEKKLKPGGSAKVIQGIPVELPKLTDLEDRRKALVNPEDPSGERYKEFIKKQKTLIKLINQESRDIGLPELKFKFLEE